MSFGEFAVDSRILKAISKLGWTRPTLVQHESLPKALNNQDISIQSKTGSGKTAVYTIAILENILRRVSDGDLKNNPNTHAIIVAPSKELCAQIYKCLYEMAQFCRRYVHLISLVDDVLYQEHIKNAAKNMPTFGIIVGTPSRMIEYLRVIPRVHLLSNLKQVIFDEADLLFGYGYRDELKQLINILSNENNHKTQTIVVSATLTKDVNQLCENILDNPILIKPDEAPLPSEVQLSQYVVKCEKGDKYLILYALIKLMLLKGRFIIFANDISTAFKLKLFLEKFGIYSCVLNCELPFNSRYHIVEYFNSGKLDILIATDLSTTTTTTSSTTSVKIDTTNNIQAMDKEYNISRGIDFVKVDNIINFSFPTSITSYIHRVGRTARAQDTGIALSLVAPMELDHLHNVECYLSEKANQNLRPFSFKIDIVEGFRYRVNDALLSINKSKITEARRAEIRREILNSKKLDEYFKKNPNDRIAIKHDFVIHTKSSLQTMGFIPEYLIPEALKANISTIPSARRFKSAGKSQKFVRIRRNNNPLKTLKR